ncbi:sensor histidine kinase [Enterovirga aerilata]|uniref:histidine kinase n=1 Tax=Enterovirga aerilata TaxID=2730920 RepID=A0A849I2K3_9HYPH|nr:HAMP domain-containing sensor histidine kinase [Enterovirga sp. DB1703]NNM71864.1 HAMP domain-containing histidine kinase [Enterovirga sp. DB1703]
MLARPELLALDAGPEQRTSAVLERVVRRSPIRWRILAIAVFNSAVALLLLGLIWNGARVLGDAWSDLRRVRQSERFLRSLDSDAERLQSLIHRYFAQSDPDVHAKIIDIRETLISQLRVQARLDPLLTEASRPLAAITERFIAGFDQLRDTRAAISLIYENKVLRPSRDMAGLYGLVTNATTDPTSLVWPALSKSREAYNAMVLAANAFYLSDTASAAREAKSYAKVIKRTAPIMADLSGGDEIQRKALLELEQRADLFENGIDELQDAFAKQARLLREAIDENADAMSAAIDNLTGGIHALEQSAQRRFDQTLEDVAVRLSLLALAFVVLVVLMGIQIAKSISEPLADLRNAMLAIASGNYDRRVSGLTAGDEIGEMARAVEVFRENAIAKRRAEEDLRQAKESAETALAELRATQTSLIEAEKLAALGGLVAGVAHEVNNPVGISLTVASSLARRCDDFAGEVASGQIRRSRLEEFTRSTATAAKQLVANLMRAGELVQSFKQVAVDRSQAERRSFDLGQAVEQILASLRPTLKTSDVQLLVEVPPGIQMDSYPGPLGQILTNLFLNSLHHAFDGRQGGTISVSARRRGRDEVEILFRDDGQGMSEEVQRCAFDPFFTTRRGSGGTGLGLHIVYNLVTARLGGRIVLSSSPGLGTTFLIVLPLVAPGETSRSETVRAEAGNV